jgi:hypothetical protein
MQPSRAPEDEYECGCFGMTRTCWVVHRFAGVILALLICLAAVACAEEDPNRSLGREANEREEAGEGGGGAPFGGEGGQAVGAPFKVPAITQLQGLPFEEVKETIEQEFLEACGTSELCVKLVVDDRPIEGFEPCAFFSIEPPAGTEIQRGSTVTIVVAATCPGGSPLSDESTDEETPDEETQDEESQDQTDEGTPSP